MVAKVSKSTLAAKGDGGTKKASTASRRSTSARTKTASTTTASKGKEFRCDRCGTVGSEAFLCSGVGSTVGLHAPIEAGEWERPTGEGVEVRTVGKQVLGPKGKDEE